MAATYAFSVRPYQMIWNQHIDNTQGFMWGAATFAIYNAPDSGKLVRIKQCDLFGNQPGSSSSTGGLAQLQRITGYEVGAGRATSQFALDTSYTPPSEIEIYANPLSVTTTGNYLRQIQAVPLAMSSIGLPGQARQFPCCAEIYDRQAGVVGQVQPYTLNAGEGLTLNMPGNSYPMAYGIGVRYRYGGNTFWATSECSVIRGFPLWTFFNTTLSGVEVERITMIEIGLAVQNRFAVEFIEGMDTTSGAIEDAVALDTAQPLPATISVRTSAIVARAGLGAGALVSYPRVRYPAWFHQPQDASMLFNQTMENATKSSMFGQSGDVETILRPGRGLAIYEEMGSNLGLPSLRGFFTVEDIATGGATPIARAYVG